MTYTTTYTATQHVTEHPTSALHYKPTESRDDVASAGKVRLVSVAELAEYCGGYRPSWTSLYGSVYDITDFIPSHPGGTVIRYAAGRDATCLFESYHSSKQVTKCLAYLKTRCTYIGELAEEYCSCKKKATADQADKAIHDDNYTEQANKATSQPESPTDTKQRSDAGAPLRALHSTNSSHTCQHQPDDTFFVTIRQRVDAYLQREHNGDRHVYQWINKTEAVVTLLLYIWASYLVSVHGSYVATLCLGVLTSRMGFMMHSGNHCAISDNSLWNRFVGLFMDVVGSSHYIWNFEHGVAHHMSPNEYTKDNDCEIGNPMFRLHPLIADIDDTNEQSPSKAEYTRQPLSNEEMVAAAAASQPPPVSKLDRFIRRHQHVIIPTAMSIGFFKWFAADVEAMITGQQGNIAIPTTVPLWTWMVACKVLWVLAHVAVPYHYFGGAYTAASVFIFMAVGALYLENVFIVNHIQEECQVPMVELGKQQLKAQQERAKQRVQQLSQSDSDSSVDSWKNADVDKSFADQRPLQLHWAVQQVCTTTNWASRSHLFNFISGGLNHQIEHHLFPTMSTCMYPLIAPIVQQTCAEFNLPYHNYATFSEAWIDMFHYLKKLGNPEQQVPIKKVM